MAGARASAAESWAMVTVLQSDRCFETKNYGPSFCLMLLGNNADLGADGRHYITWSHSFISNGYISLQELSEIFAERLTPLGQSISYSIDVSPHIDFIHLT
jgi:hypothetical protein